MEQQVLGRSLPLVIAHRGDSAHFPENTIPAFTAAVAAGADMIELDVTMTADGHLVVIHDRTVDRTTDGTGRVSDLTLARLRKLDAGSWKGSRFRGVRVPTLEEVFEAVGKTLPINIEIKADGKVPDGLLPMLLATMRKVGISRSVILSSFKFTLLERLRTLDGAIAVSVLSDISEPVNDIVKKVRAVGALSYNPDQKHLDEEKIGLLHGEGILVFPWSTGKRNTATTMKRLLSWDTDGFFANDPRLFRELSAGIRHPLQNG
ncbi:MAG: glycerophosphodiester phosphodiesterase [Deltaproteobacteria bacterium]|nr:glycerophosphodiester phosphodiesterase [Deltaproteobacteria bacterium]